jgi:hypothetical protein
MKHATAAYMAIGLLTASDQLHVQEHWGCGQIELVDNLTSYADFCDALAEAAYSYTRECPGVAAYEIAEPFGEWYGQQVLLCVAGGALPDHAACCSKLRELVYDFYSRAIPTSPSGRASQALSEAMAAVDDPPEGATS